MWKSQRNEKLLNLKFNLTGVKKFRFKLDIIYNTEKYILVFFQSGCLSQPINWIRWSRFGFKRWPDRLWKTFGRIARLGRNTWESKYLKFCLGLFYQHKFEEKKVNLFSKCLGGLVVTCLSRVQEVMGSIPRPGQTKDLKIGICCFSTKHVASGSKNNDLSDRSRNNVSV